MKKVMKVLIFLLFICGITLGSYVFANGADYSDTGGSFVVPKDNVGIGTYTPQGKLVVINGNIGIGTASPHAALDINGGVRLGNQTMGTSCSTEGVVAYDYINHMIVYCNATSWGSL